MTHAQHSSHMTDHADMVVQDSTANALAGRGLTLAQYQALSAVVEANADSGALRNHYVLTPSYAMDILLYELEGRGLIDRTPCGPQGRRASVRPTDAGLRLAQLATRALNAIQPHRGVC